MKTCTNPHIIKQSNNTINQTIKHTSQRGDPTLFMLSSVLLDFMKRKQNDRKIHMHVHLYTYRPGRVLTAEGKCNFNLLAGENEQFERKFVKLKL